MAKKVKVGAKIKAKAKAKAKPKATAKGAKGAKGKSGKSGKGEVNPLVGKKAPAFRLETDDGKTVDLKDFAGKRVVVYFYPKDDTPGCTRQACDFTAQFAEFKKAGVTVVGVSPDDLKSHAKFRTKHKLGIKLASDPGAKAARAWGAWGLKQNYGKSYEGIIRSTFLIDEDGKVARVWPKVKVDGHVDAVLAAASGEED
jgi:peroxiredoxin Q/BCP